MRPRFCILAAALATALTSTPTEAQPFTGTFSVDTNDGGRMVVTLREGRDGSVAGRVTSAQLDMAVEGTVEGDALVGVLRGIDGSLYFEAARYDNELWLTLYGVGPGGEPDYGDFQEVGLYLEGTEPTAGAPDGNPLGRAGANPLAAAGSDPYVGTFTDGNVTLQLQGVAGQYQGRLSIGGRTYTVAATGGASGLQGVIAASDAEYALAIQSFNGGLYLVSGGEQYQLYPQGAYGPGGYGPGGYGPRGAFGPDGLPGGAAGRYPPGQYPPGARPPVSGRGAPPATGSPLGRPLAPGFTESHPNVSGWTRYLAGTKVTRIGDYTSRGIGDFSARADIYLCSDHSASLREDLSGSVDVRGAPGRSGAAATGTWYVITDGQVVVLILELDGGAVLEMRVSDRNGATYVDGGRAHVTPTELCR